METTEVALRRLDRLSDLSVLAGDLERPVAHRTYHVSHNRFGFFPLLFQFGVRFAPTKSIFQRVA